jgi:hypothetical protein
MTGLRELLFESNLDDKRLGAQPLAGFESKAVALVPRARADILK